MNPRDDLRDFLASRRATRTPQQPIVGALAMLASWTARRPVAERR